VSFRCGIGRSSDSGRIGCIPDRDDRLGVKSVISLHDFVLLRLGLIDVAEGSLVHKGEMGIVERIFHQPKRNRVPLVVELVDSAVTDVAVFWNVGNVAQRFIKRDPDVTIAGLGSKRARLGVGNWLFEWNCGIITSVPSRSYSQP
jgi:hypothetical protein